MLNLTKPVYCFLVASLIFFTSQAPIYDDTQTGIAGSMINSTTCNKNSLNDFTFSSSSSLICTGTTCTVTNPSQNTVNYLDAKNNQRVYTLTTATVVNQNIIGSLNYAFLFTFMDSSSQNVLYLVIPFDVSANLKGNYSYQAINLANTTDKSFYSLASFSANPNSTLSSGLSFSAFNFLTSFNYNEFYQVMDSTFTKTLLVSKAFLQVSTTSGLLLNPSSNFTFAGDYKHSADVLCWGQFSAGQFQTHMRQSVPLWFFVTAVMSLWMYVLIPSQNTEQIFESSFQNNKWTSWSIYSLFYLAHQDFFTRMSRGALMFITIIWQAMVVSSIYSTQWSTEGNSIIIWAAVVGWVASIPFPYIFGNLFLKKVYRLEQDQMAKKIEQHYQVADKKRREKLERDAILIGQEVYSINYWYYSTILILLAVFSILSVHTMQSVPSLNYFYRNWQWLMSIGIIIGWEHFVIDPILTACFGDREWYQSRGYFYNGQLGQLYRKAD